MSMSRQNSESGVEISLPAGGIIISMLLSVLLWSYVVFTAFIWFGACLFPGSSVLIRIAASILSDLVWIPPALFVWVMSITWIFNRVIGSRNMKWRIILRIMACASVIIFFILSYETAFRLLFILFAFFIFGMVSNFRGAFSWKRIFSYYLPFILILMLTVFYYRLQLLPGGACGEKADDIKVMSYNIFAHAGYEDRLDVFETIERESPDVICIMEFNPMRDPVLFEERLGEKYPYMLTGDSLTKWTRSAAFIMSRFPLKKIRVEKISEKADRHVNFIFAEMDVHGKTVNIVNYHLITVGHSIARAAREKFKSRELVNTAAEKEAAFDEEKYRQVHYLIDKISTFMEPTILCGDLNDTPNSRVYHILDRQLINTFSAKGWGLGSTFGDSWIRSKFKNNCCSALFARDVMRIDHIFVNNDFDVVSANVIEDAKGSDHKPVVAILRLDEK